jgi:hypothetical protein
MFPRTLFLSSLIIGILSFIIPFNTLAQTLIESTSQSISARVGLFGGGSRNPIESGVKFSGLAFPNARVTVTSADEEPVSVTADSKGNFTIFISGTADKLYTLYAIDSYNRRSVFLNFPTVLYTGYITDISGIRFPPTVITDKLGVKTGEYLTIEGSAIPGEMVEINFYGPREVRFFAPANNKGIYNITIPIIFPQGEYVIKSRYVNDTRSSEGVSVIIGTSTIPAEDAVKNIPGDCNVDHKIDLVDFSILAYWYGRKNPPRCVDTNHDGVINLTDFSIIAYYWNSYSWESYYEKNN